MFYPVRIFNQIGKLEKEIPTETLSRRYWKEFNEAVRTNIQITSKKGRPRRKDPTYQESDYDESFFSED